MAQQHLNTGSQANDGTGDTLRSAFIKTEDNFIDLYNIRGPSYFPDYTGSLIMTSSEGGDSVVLKLTGSLETTLTSSMATASIKFNDGTTTQYAYIRKPTEAALVLGYPRIRLRGGTQGVLEDIQIEPDGSTGYLRLQKIGDKKIDIGTSTFTPMDLFVKSQNNNNAFVVTNNRVGINVSPSSVGLGSTDINGTIRAQNYFVSNVPLTTGDFQSTTSNTIFGRGGTTQVVYIS